MILHHLSVVSIFFLLYTYTKATLPQLCYVDAGVLAPEYIHPYWTSFKTPHYSCCKVGNKCLEQNACYDLDTGNTYLYGCMDPEYKDERCPSKCGTDHNASNWVGLVYCNGEYDRPYYTRLCDGPNNCYDCPRHEPWDPKLEKLSKTECDDLKQHYEENVAFINSESISDILALPAETGMEAWYSRNSDRWIIATSSSSSAAVTQISSPTSESAVNSAVPTSSTSATASSINPPIGNVHEKTSKKITILASILGAVVGVAAFAIALVQIRKRRQAQEVPIPVVEEQSEVEMYGHKAELEGDTVLEPPVHEPHGTSSHIFEMDGSTVGSPVSLETPYVSPLLSQYSGQGDFGEHRISGIYSPPTPQVRDSA